MILATQKLTDEERLGAVAAAAAEERIERMAEDLIQQVAARDDADEIRAQLVVAGARAVVRESLRQLAQEAAAGTRSPRT